MAGYSDAKRQACIKLKRKNKARAVEYKGGKCQRCQGVFHPCVYDFHHTDPTLKEARVSHLMSVKWENVKVELDKCELLCSNCHRLEHCQYV